MVQPPNCPEHNDIQVALTKSTEDPATCVEVLQRFEGYVAQYLGDGLLVYFGYPQAHEDGAQGRLDVAGATGLTPLVRREHVVGLLWECWAQSHDGLGQVVLLSGEAGIGKSRLVRALTDREF
ncbi:MAG: hypothetical protein ACRERE_36555 [Candidatus Entotheonellia bacterium]